MWILDFSAEYSKSKWPFYLLSHSARNIEFLIGFIEVRGINRKYPLFDGGTWCKICMHVTVNIKIHYIKKCENPIYFTKFYKLFENFNVRLRIWQSTSCSKDGEMCWTLDSAKYFFALTTISVLNYETYKWTSIVVFLIEFWTRHFLYWFKVVWNFAFISNELLSNHISFHSSIILLKKLI